MRTVEQIQAAANQLFAQLGALEFQLRTVTRDRDAVLDQLRAVDVEMGHAKTVAPQVDPTDTPSQVVAAPVASRADAIAAALAAAGPVFAPDANGARAAT